MSEATGARVRALSPRDVALRVTAGAAAGLVLGSLVGVLVLPGPAWRLAVPAVLALLVPAAAAAVRRRYPAPPPVPVVFRVVRASQADWAPGVGMHRRLTVVAQPADGSAPFTSSIDNPTSWADAEIPLGSVWTGSQPHPGLGDIVPGPATSAAAEELREAVEADPGLLPDEAAPLPRRQGWAMPAGPAEAAQILGTFGLAAAAGLGLTALLG